MGNWNLTIRGVGPHGNNIPADIERQAAKFVEQLKSSHNVIAASVTSGGETDLTAQAYAHLAQNEPGQDADLREFIKCSIDSAVSMHQTTDADIDHLLDGVRSRRDQL